MHRVVVGVLGDVAVLDAPQVGEQPVLGEAELGDEAIVIMSPL